MNNSRELVQKLMERYFLITYSVENTRGHFTCYNTNGQYVSHVFIQRSVRKFLLKNDDLIVVVENIIELPAKDYEDYNYSLL